MFTKVNMVKTCGYMALGERGLWGREQKNNLHKRIRIFCCWWKNCVLF